MMVQSEYGVFYVGMEIYSISMLTLSNEQVAQHVFCCVLQIRIHVLNVDREYDYATKGHVQCLNCINIKRTLQLQNKSP